MDAPVINEIEFEREGEIEIKFVPIRPGEYDFEIERLLKVKEWLVNLSLNNFIWEKISCKK